MSRSPLLLLSVVTAGTLALSGCSILGGGAAKSPSGAAPSASASATAGAKAADPAKNGAAASGIDLSNPPKPIGSVVLPKNKDGHDDTLVELLELRTKDKALLGVFRVTPRGTTSDKRNLFNVLGMSSCPSLVDLKNLKKYACARALTSDDQISGKMGDPMYFFTGWAIPTGTDTINIQFSTGPSIENVSWK